MRPISRRNFLTQAGVGLALSGCLSSKARDHVAVFDVLWSTVDETYFDPAMGGIDWKAARSNWRPKASRAETSAALYLDVLFPMLDQFQTSHVHLRPPGGALALTNGRSFPIPRQKRGSAPFMVTPQDEAGMGAVLTWTGSAYIIEDAALGSPAHAAGVRPGEQVQIAGFSSPNDQHHLRLVGRDGSNLSVNWAPKLAPPPRESRLVGRDAALLRFDVFDRPSIDWAISTLRASMSRAAVLDLRQNSGGLLVDMARFTSALLPEGRPLGLFRSRAREYRPTTGSAQQRFTAPLAVLVGPRTASAAEITAAAMQHHGRARLFGTPTSGNVLASRTYDLPDGGKLTLPFADYLTPAGLRIEERGVAPDVIAPRTYDSMVSNSDPALDAALDWLKHGQ